MVSQPKVDHFFYVLFWALFLKHSGQYWIAVMAKNNSNDQLTQKYQEWIAQNNLSTTLVSPQKVALLIGYCYYLTKAMNEIIQQ